MTSQIGRSNVSYVITFNYEHKCSNHLIVCIMFRQIGRINVSYVIMSNEVQVIRQIGRNIDENKRSGKLGQSDQANWSNQRILRHYV